MTASSKRFRTRLTRSRQISIKKLYETRPDASAQNDIIETLAILGLPFDFLTPDPAPPVEPDEDAEEEIDDELAAQDLEDEDNDYVDTLPCPVRNCTFTGDDGELLLHLQKTHRLSEAKAVQRLLG